MRSLFAMLVLTATGVMAADKPAIMIVGHRGEPKNHPENTLQSFEACIQIQAGFELDVRRTKDGHLVVLHDATLDRTTDGKGKVEDIVLADLKKLDAGSKFDAKFAGKRVPELHEVFSAFGKHLRKDDIICIDLKINDGKVEADVVKLAKDASVLDKCLFIGAAIENAEVRQRVRTADAKAHVACLADKQEGLAASLEDKNSDWAYVRFIPTEEQMKAIRKAGKKVILVGPLVMGKEPENWKKAAAFGVDALLTDYPREAREIFR